MGCGEAEAPCQQLRVLETRYESQAACTAATEAAVMRFTDLDYPVVVAQCHAAQGSAKLDASAVRLPEPEATSLFSRS
jgi:hypothetical protein